MSRICTPTEYQQAIHDLHTHLHTSGRFPRGDQAQIIREFFDNGKMVLLAQCGRDSGKTECAILYIGWRFALTHPDSQIYIICPEKLQGKKIYWSSNRLPNYGPAKYIAQGGKLKSELRLVFKNESSITVDGCENYDALRGIKPHLVLYDEKQKHTKHFDEEVMQPNFSRGNVALVAACTPPKRYCDYVDFRKEIVEKVQQGHPKYFYVELPTWANPLSDRQWLQEKKDDLIRRGKQNVWYREYEGKMMFDTESAILPYWDRQRHVKTEDEIRKIIRNDIKRFEWYAVFDPGTATCFAALFLCVNPYTSEVYIVDEIYETRRGYNTAMKIWERANRIKNAWYPDLDQWKNIYDSAAAWFPMEVLAEYAHREEDTDFGFMPTNKQKLSPRQEEGRAGESILNALMESHHVEDNGVTLSSQLFHVNEKCENFFREVESYVTDETGKYPKSFDHLMDCLFYWVINSNYTITNVFDPLHREKQQEAKWRGETFDSLVRKELAKNDWARSMEDQLDFYDEGDEWH